MDAKDVLAGILVTVFVFGPYFLGAVRGQREFVKWRELFTTLKHSLTWKGLAWATAFPTCWVLLFYAFVTYVRFSLGRWPEFGHPFEGLSFALLYQTTWYGARAMVSSLYVAPVIFLGCCLFRQWRYVAVYAIAYAGGVGIAIGAMFLAPHPFLNWYFD